MTCRRSVVLFASVAVHTLLLGSASAQGRDGSSSSHSGTIRDYYVAVELVEWDYAPGGKSLISGLDLVEDEDAQVFVENTAELIGRKYLKSLYKEYTDDTYNTAKEAPIWAGNLGPILRAEVGDILHVHFKNNLPAEDGLSASMHPHGVLYTPEHEGAFWLFNTEPGSAVAPGDSFTYEWTARESSGPAAASGLNSNLWFYHGHVSSVADMYSGQMGPLIIYNEGILDDDGLPTDVDEEFVLMFLVSDENQSNYLQKNIDTYGGMEENEDFEESNLMHSMNGFIYGNLPGLDMVEGDKVRWHVAAYGTEVDLHTSHWHGNNVVFQGRNVDTIELLPSSFFTAIMEPDAVGRWLHVNDHILAGMQAFYTVHGRDNADDDLSFFYGYSDDTGSDFSTQEVEADEDTDVQADSAAPSNVISGGFFSATAAASCAVAASWATLVLASEVI